ncbi:hypothetical protein LINPERHAP1_LOCUS38089 [Linum perenne]
MLNLMASWQLVYLVGNILWTWLNPGTMSWGLNLWAAGSLLLIGIRDRKTGLQLIPMDRLFNLRARLLLVVSSATTLVIAR